MSARRPANVTSSTRVPSAPVAPHAANARGWLKPSQRDKQKAEKDLKMNHYFYHCERNPDAFNRLKIENWERETIERTRDEAETIRKNASK